MQLREFDPNQPLQTTDHFIRDRKRTTREFGSNRALHVIPSLHFETGNAAKPEESQHREVEPRVEFRKSQKKRWNWIFQIKQPNHKNQESNKSQAITQREKSNKKFNRAVNFPSPLSPQEPPRETQMIEENRR
jgi:hypothetical protein